MRNAFRTIFVGLLLAAIYVAIPGAIRADVPQTGHALSISILSLSGSSQQLVIANSGRHFLQCQNTGNANVGINIVGGTAAIGGLDTDTLAPGASTTFDQWVPDNLVNVIGTAGQPISCKVG